MKALQFEGSGFEYFKIWIVNILLTIITVGLYYPWAKVRNRRYFCANSVLEGRNFEYHATGKQLFIGYLIAMGLFLAFIFIQNISPTGSVIVVLIFVFAFPWIIWRSLKFNMRMTSFSNVRFGFEGVLSGAYINYLLLPIVSVLVLYGIPIALAIAIPMMGLQMGVMLGLAILIAAILFVVLTFFIFSYLKKRNTHYAINGYRYGQGVFHTNVETKTFAMILLKTAGISILAFIALIVAITAIAYFTGAANEILQLQNSLEDPEAIQMALAGGLGLIIGLVYLGFIIVSLLVVAYMYTRQRTYIYDNSNLDNKITFASTLRSRPFAWVMITNFIIIIFTLGLGLPWAKVRMARLLLENTQVNTDHGFEMYITQKQKEQSSLGEQIGDAFDVDVGIGF